jgi:hypothetical protein
MFYLSCRCAGLLQPWRCLCRGSVQITRTTPLRRMILQFRQIFLTDANTFMSVSGRRPTAPQWRATGIAAASDP